MPEIARGQGEGLAGNPDDKEACLNCILQALAKGANNPNMNAVRNFLNATYVAFATMQPDSNEPAPATEPTGDKPLVPK